MSKDLYPGESDPSEELRMVQDLLPWYAQGTLEGAELAFMEQWMAQHMAEHPEIGAELAWLRSSSRQLQAAKSARMQESGMQDAMELGLAGLMQRIAQERTDEAVPAGKTAAGTAARPANGKTGAGWLLRLGNWFDEKFGINPAASAFAAAALILVQSGVIGALLLQDSAEQEALSGSTGLVLPANAVVLTIAFNPQSREQDIRQLLLNAKANIVAGPSALGLYRVSVPEDQLVQAMQQLQAAKGVVESVQR